ncbi:hypothetical protein [Thiothrix subterranea]|uniref:Uncharacterized protein n=1 Tax=Thiothrix subterranea TaxID=2735563 RepID=A0AA51R617_9GAMM|nr:hypothetical protein [Thiothrix subterranea]MDQ5769026.1 hypothetical protein [Thiothrix subterranea]WML88415.1 hypothetical protein RCG00_08535 [Thiothrix subterranea]
MYTLINSMTFGRFLTEQASVIAVAFVIAEMFYKFHSFTLECAAFLVTWFLLDSAVQYFKKFAKN